MLVPFFVAEGWHTQETIPDDLGINRPAGQPGDGEGRAHDLLRARRWGPSRRSRRSCCSARARRGRAFPESAVSRRRRRCLTPRQVRGRARCRGGLGDGARGAARLGGRGGDGGAHLPPGARCARRAEAATRSATRRDAAAPAGRAGRGTATRFAARGIAQTTGRGEHRPLKTVAEPAARLGAGRGAGRARAVDRRSTTSTRPAPRTGTRAARARCASRTGGRRRGGRAACTRAVGLLAGRRGARTRCAPAAATPCACAAWRGGSTRDPRPLDGPGATRAAGPRATRRCPAPRRARCSSPSRAKVLTLERSPRQRGARARAAERGGGGAAARDGRRRGRRARSGAVREGEFDEPTNPRRVRYLAARLADGAHETRRLRRSSPARDARAPCTATVPAGRLNPLPRRRMTPDSAPRPPDARTRFELRPRDGQPPIRCDLRVPEGPLRRSAVILCHGFKGFRTWGSFPHLARALAAHGHAAITVDFSRNGVGADRWISRLSSCSPSRPTRGTWRRCGWWWTRYHRASWFRCAPHRPLGALAGWRRGRPRRSAGAARGGTGHLGRGGDHASLDR